MNNINPLAFIIPVFIILFSIEYLWARHKKKHHHIKFENVISNLSIGLTERLLYLWTAIIFYKFFWYIYSYSLYKISTNWLTVTVLLLLTDFIWYWYHRLGHEINIFWAAHVVHHQSNDFNYSTGVRITIFQAFIRYGFWAVLPLVGFHPDIVALILIVHGTYAFLTHTEFFPKWKFLEYIFITPSLHAVHHASNQKYLNKNYGDIFVFWDKLFGTFQTETEKPFYGLTKPLNSKSYIWQHFHYYLEIIYTIYIQKGLTNKLKVIFDNPDNTNIETRTILESYLGVVNNKNTALPKMLKKYIGFQILCTIISLFFLTLFVGNIPTTLLLIHSAIIIITLINCCALLEQQKYVIVPEYIRIFLIHTLLSFQILSIQYFVSVGILLIAIIISIPFKDWYYQSFYENKISI